MVSINLPPSKVITKRAIDLAGAIIAMLLLLPIGLFIVLRITIESGFPVFFFSQRTGMNGKPFNMPKFRSMRKETPLIPSPEFNNICEHVTPFGDFLRRTSLDELPQFWSVCKGDMSLVGPRPVLDKSESAICVIRKKTGVDLFKPGITGWAQINGRGNISMVDKVKFDCEYLHRQNVWFDIYIMLRTLRNVFKQRDY